ncbi:BIG/ATPase V1 complex, subunit S1 [Lasiosphaeria hispida]|uniref:Protein BIG1 n=1 Tax=Lasiosphaeria hispida TaxID=260671 RepID=A0AAJ0HPU8_9PEZI|nr:BIG/ATPase V1 complex, subunit S1 [Lasiosphaeria hispida]
MQLSLAATLLACTAAVQAFSDSSPLIIFSSSNSISTYPHGETNLMTNTQALAQAKQLLQECPTSRYILVSQPNTHYADIRDAGPGGKWHMPNLAHFVTDVFKTKMAYTVSEVIGQVSGTALGDYVTATCAEQGKTVSVERVELTHLPGLKEMNKREEVVADNDHELGQLLETLDNDWTVILFSDPNEFQTYEPEFIEAVHTDIIVSDLKRHVQNKRVFISQRVSNSTNNLPLFEKYQFFTPGIFMALIALVVILSILTVGLKALASLEVSYGAFDKENGPAAQRKP